MRRRFAALVVLCALIPPSAARANTAGPIPMGRAAGTILDALGAHITINDTGEQSEDRYSWWGGASIDVPFWGTEGAAAQSSRVSVWDGYVESTASLGTYNGYIDGLRATAVADCESGVHGDAAIDAIGLAPVDTPLQPNTIVFSNGREEITANYQRVISSHEIEVAALRTIDSYGRENFYAYAHSKLTGCP